MILTLPRRLMRDFRSVIRIDMILMVHGGHQGSMNHIITSRFVRNQPAGLSALAFEKTAEEAYRGFFVASLRWIKISIVSPS